MLFICYINLHLLRLNIYSNHSNGLSTICICSFKNSLFILSIHFSLGSDCFSYWFYELFFKGLSLLRTLRFESTLNYTKKKWEQLNIRPGKIQYKGLFIMSISPSALSGQTHCVFGTQLETVGHLQGFPLLQPLLQSSWIHQLGLSLS